MPVMLAPIATVPPPCTYRRFVPLPPSIVAPIVAAVT